MQPARWKLIAFLWLGMAASGQTIDPVEYEAALNEAERLFTKGDLEAVIRTLMPWVEKQRDLPGAQHGLGLAYYRQGNFVGAIRHLSVALKLEPENSPTWKQTAEILAMSYYFSNRAQDAIPLLEKAIAWSPGNTNLLYTLGMAHLFTHRPDECRRIFAQLFQLQPDDAKAFLLTADLMVQENYVNDAEPLILEAMKRQPDLPQASLKLGLIALTNGKAGEAAPLLEKEVAASPSHSMAWHYLGDAYFRSGKLDQAVEALQRAIWLNLRSTRSYVLLSNVYTQQGRLFVAESALKRALDMEPQNYEARFLLARIYYKTNRTDLAKKEIALAEKYKVPDGTRK